jgi:murein DD-endopeptidase MepM/ murein hydrolase activator NlpD
MRIIQNKRMKSWRFLMLATVVFTGCLGSVINDDAPSDSDLESSRETAAIHLTISAAVEPTSELANPDVLLTPSVPTPVPDPLRFTLPTRGAVPVSSWRPALYPVPWALTDQDHFFFTRPVKADEVNWPAPEYRYGNVEFLVGIPHTGVDIVAPEGTDVIATGPGLVVWAGYGLYYGFEDPEDPYGIAVAIRHDFGYKGEPLYTVYAHMSEVKVARGERVQLGDIIGLVGDTGQTTGAHLHYEVRLGGNDYYHSVNPELWMAPPQGWGVLVGRLMSSVSILLKSQEMRVTSIETNENWYVQTYGALELINRDSNYRENFVLSGLPAGTYEIFIPYQGYEFRLAVRIYPGAVTFFSFRGFNGFSTAKSLGIVPTNVPD